MAYRFTRQRIRIAVDVSKKFGTGTVTEVLSGGEPIFARNAGLQVEVALFFGAEILEIDNIATATLEVKQDNDPDTANAMAQTIGTDSMLRGLTLEQWQSHDPSFAHFRFTFTSSETADGNFGTPADENVEHFFCLWGRTDDDSIDNDVFGVGKFKSFDAGIGAATPTPPVAGTGATLDQISALLQGYALKIGRPGDTITFISPSTGKRVKLGADDNGDFDVQAQTST